MLGFLILSRAWLGIAPVSSLVCFIFHVFATIDMTLFSILFIFLVIMFIVYFDYMLSTILLSTYSCISSYSARSSVHGVSGRHCVSVVLIHCLHVDTPYILGHVVDRGCDTPIESFVVHSPNIGACRVRLRKEEQVMFLIFLSNPLCEDMKLILAMTTKCNCTNQRML